MKAAQDKRLSCPKCSTRTWSTDIVSFFEDHDTPEGKRCSYRPGAVWHVVSNVDGTVLAVYGAALVAEALNFASGIGVGGVYYHCIIGIRPRVGQSISMHGARRVES